MSQIIESFHAILKKAVEMGASDIHILAGNPWRLRLHGDLFSIQGMEKLTPEQTLVIARETLAQSRTVFQDQLESYSFRVKDEDSAYSLAGVGRFRVNIASQRGSLAIVLRHIPFGIPTFEELGLPPVISQIALERRGLVLVTGPAGSGKSTTLASMINFINHQRGGKIVTIENPIEFTYQDDKACVMQREVGVDTEDFATAMRAAVRQDPDIILVGEMRDRQTIDAAIKAAEYGSLVFSTTHSTDAAKTISRLVGAFEGQEEHYVRMRLAETVTAVISQRLLPRSDGQGRVLACEVMRSTLGIREYILAPEKPPPLSDLIVSGHETLGMQTLDQNLQQLFRDEKISLEVAKSASPNPDDFERNLMFV